jgi:hypothetical protein
MICNGIARTVPKGLRCGNVAAPKYPAIMKTIPWLPESRLLAANLSGWCTGAVLYMAVLTAHGQTFYIKPNGSNAANGLSPSTAWQTIDRVIDELDLGGNKTFLFERDGRYRGCIPTPVFTGNVHFGAYGSGDAPVIAGSHAIADNAWTRHGPGFCGRGGQCGHLRHA